jgi:hypothetical protein
MAKYIEMYASVNLKSKAKTDKKKSQTEDKK